MNSNRPGEKELYKKFICHGNCKLVCCFFDGEPCKYLEENTVEGRRWACQLYRELGSWEKVHNDKRYIEDIKPRINDVDCGEYPFGKGGSFAEGIMKNLCNS